MKRRNFIVTSTGLLGLGSLSNAIGGQSAIGISFSIPQKFTPSQVQNNNVVVTISDITIKTTNISDISSDIILDLQLYTDTDNLRFASIKQYNLSLNSSDDIIRIPSVSLNINSASNRDISNASLVKLRLVANHPDITKEYSTETLVGSTKTITDDFDDGSLDTSKWRFIDPSGGASYMESSSRIKLVGGSGSRPYLRTESQIIDGANGNSINLESRAKINTEGNSGQIQMYGWWDGNYSGTYDTPVNAVGVHINDTSENNADIRIYEGGSVRQLASTSVSGLNSYNNWELDLSGDFSNFTVTVYKDGDQILSESGLSFSPTNNSPYATVVAREVESTTSFDDLSITI